LDKKKRFILKNNSNHHHNYRYFRNPFRRWNKCATYGFAHSQPIGWRTIDDDGRTAGAVIMGLINALYSSDTSHNITCIYLWFGYIWVILCSFTYLFHITLTYLFNTWDLHSFLTTIKIFNIIHYYCTHEYYTVYVYPSKDIFELWPFRNIVFVRIYTNPCYTGK
jgi:hypothetical protein